MTNHTCAHCPVCDVYCHLCHPCQCDHRLTNWAAQTVWSVEWLVYPTPGTLGIYSTRKEAETAATSAISNQKLNIISYDQESSFTSWGFKDGTVLVLSWGVEK